MEIGATAPADPYAVIQRNLASSLDVATVHSRLLRSGRDDVGEVAVFVVEGSLDARQMSELELDDAEAIFVEVHPDTVARTMARTAAEEWSGTAVLGLVALVEDYYPASGPLIEGFVEEGWRTARQFGRLDKLTDREHEVRDPSALRVPSPPLSPVVVATEGGDVVEVRRRYPTDQVLNWEAPSRAVPNRY